MGLNTLLIFVWLAYSETPDREKKTLELIQKSVFDIGCTQVACHDAQTQAGKLDLSSLEASFLNLVGASEQNGVPATNSVAQKNGWKRVVPGDPERSFLVRKLVEPGIGEGSPMPSTQKMLHSFYLDMIRTWIKNGALPD